MFVRDGDTGGRGRKGEGSIAGANPEDQDVVDRRQNNKNVKAVSAMDLYLLPRYIGPWCLLRH